jgi:6-phosphogluconolactonase
MDPHEIIILSDPAALAVEAARRFVAIAAAATSQDAIFRAALAGGSTPAGLYRLLARHPFHDRVNWKKTLLYLGDERCVPPDDPRSNTRMIRETLLNGILPTSATVRVPPAGLAPAEAAAAYARSLRRDFDLRGRTRPHFHLILLGLGDDGHTASLFPGMPALDEWRHLVVATDVPAYVRPLVPRITFTLPVLNAAEHVMFLVSGASKAPAAAAALSTVESGDRVPARRIQPRSGQITWLLDSEAAAGLR